jgi:hypothetical protein
VSNTHDASTEKEAELESMPEPSTVPNELPPISSLALKPGNSNVDNVQFRVSSRHLMLASPWFNRALKREGWSESARDEEDGLFHITAEDWDADAFLILLNIFHLRNRQVPRAVSLDMIAKIAVLVDYYECEESIELFTAMWIKSLKENTPVPSVACRNLVLWIWTSWVFDIGDCFKRATAVAIKSSVENFHTLGLPIPSRVSGKFMVVSENPLTN